MLKKLDSIGWSQLHHAYGSAEDVPERLRDLVSEDEGCRNDALTALFESICHQGSIYEATAYAVPFLIEFLQAAAQQDRCGILVLLQSIATGAYRDTAHRLLPDHPGISISGVPARSGGEPSPDRAAHDAVVGGTDAYLCLLKDADPSIRAAAAYVISACAERASHIEPAILARLTRETDSTVKAGLVLALNRLSFPRDPRSTSTPRVDADRMLTDFLDVSHPAIVRLAAAIGLIERSASDDFPVALDTLVETFGEASDPWGRAPWSRGDLIRDVLNALEKQPNLQIALLVRLLRDRDPEVRMSAACAIGDQCCDLPGGAEQFTPVLVELLSDDDADVRRWAASTLGEIGPAGHRGE